MSLSREFSAVILTLASAWAACGGGCFASSEQGICSPDPNERRQAMIQAAQHQDHKAIPDLITRLDSDDAGERFLAIGTLEKITGQTLGYDYAGSPKDRSQAVDRWVAWWKSGGGASASASGTAMSGPAQRN